MHEHTLSDATDELPEPFEFDKSYDRHVDLLYRLCFSYMKNTADAEDIVADVFLKLLESNKQFQSLEHEKAWLIRVAINLCKNHLKHWWRKRANLDDYQNLKSKNEFPSDGALNAISNLPKRYRAVIYLYYYEGYSSAEIARILRKPRSTILNHLSEARKILKGVLEYE